MMHWFGGGYGMGFGGGIFMILFWVLVILGVVTLLNSYQGANLKPISPTRLPVKYSRRDLPKEKSQRKSLKMQ